MTDFAAERERMIERTIARRGLDDPALIAAFRAVPREAFVDGSYATHAYDDAPLPIESGQTISQPYIVALTIDAAEIGPDDKVLEIGAGSGYAAAVIGQIAARGRSPSSGTTSWSSWRVSGCSGWAMTMSTSSRATAPAAARPKRRSTPSSPPPAAAMCRGAARPAEARRTDRHADRRPAFGAVAGQADQARATERLTARISAPCASCR